MDGVLGRSVLVQHRRDLPGLRDPVLDHRPPKGLRVKQQWNVKLLWLRGGNLCLWRCSQSQGYSPTRKKIQNEVCLKHGIQPLFVLFAVSVQEPHWPGRRPKA